MNEEDLQELQQKQNEFWEEVEMFASLFEVTVDYYLMEFA